jgi:hypothetical protein
MTEFFPKINEEKMLDTAREIKVSRVVSRTGGSDLVWDVELFMPGFQWRRRRGVDDFQEGKNTARSRSDFLLARLACRRYHESLFA